MIFFYFLSNWDFSIMASKTKLWMILVTLCNSFLGLFLWRKPCLCQYNKLMHHSTSTHFSPSCLVSLNHHCSFCLPITSDLPQGKRQDSTSSSTSAEGLEDWVSLPFQGEILGKSCFLLPPGRESGRLGLSPLPRGRAWEEGSLVLLHILVFKKFGFYNASLDI